MNFGGTSLQINQTGVNYYAFGVYDSNNNYYREIMYNLEVLEFDIPSFDSQPENLEFTAGQVGNSLDWDIYDSNPSFYTIYQNGSLLLNQTWSGNETVSLNVDSLVSGVYNITLQIYDVFGNYNSDQVIVTVNEAIEQTDPGDDQTNTTQSEEDETSDPEEDDNTGLIIAIVSTVVILLAGGGYVVYRRKIKS